jgi:hypothetical protein
MLNLASLKADADEAVVLAKKARTYADDARTRLSLTRVRFDRSIRTADARARRLERAQAPPPR